MLSPIRLTPSGAEAVLYNCCSQPEDGAYPYADLVFDKQGNLDGATQQRGTYGYGTVCKGGTETVLHSFGQLGDRINPTNQSWTSRAIFTAHSVAARTAMARYPS